MTAIRPFSRLRLPLAWGSAVVLGFTLGACFNGLDAEGLPCETDAQCGPLMRCEDKFCGGVFACFDGSELIEVEWLCDDEPDCEDESDEQSIVCDGDGPNDGPDGQDGP